MQRIAPAPFFVLLLGFSLMNSAVADGSSQNSETDVAMMSSAYEMDPEFDSESAHELSTAQSAAVRPSPSPRPQAAAPSPHAQSRATAEGRWSLGFVLATIRPANLGYFDGAFGGYGGQLDYRAQPHWNFGAQVITGRKDGIAVTPIMLRATYFIEEDYGFYFGGQIGGISLSASGLGGNTWGDFGIGPVIGFDFKLVGPLHLAIEVNYVFTVGSDYNYRLGNFVLPLKYIF